MRSVPDQSAGVFILFLGVLVGFMNDTAGAQEPEIILWKSDIPGPVVPAEPAESQITAADGITRRFNVSRPRLLVHLPPNDTPRCGAALIIVPGGGFGRLSDEHEGLDPARWFASQGIVTFQLVYRTPTAKHDQPNAGPVMDVQQAVMEVRRRAAEYAIDPARIAVLGFSAGGQAALVATASECQFADTRQSSEYRPNLLLLLYPYQVASSNTELRAEIQVSQTMPPTFIAQAADDTASKVSGTILLFQQLLASRVPAELHVYQTGGHGYGMRPRPGSTVATDWPHRAVDWLKLHGFFNNAAVSP